MAAEPGSDDFQPIDGNRESDDDGFRSFGEAGSDFIDPASAVSSGNAERGGSDNSSASGGGSTGKRRGRKPGSTNKAKTASVDLGSVEALLMAIHTGLSVITKAPEFELTREEAHKIAEAGTRVSRHYNMQATAKSIDIANLAIVLGTAYGSRFMAMRMRREMERAERRNKARQDAGNVIDLGNGGISASQ